MLALEYLLYKNQCLCVCLTVVYARPQFVTKKADIWYKPSLHQGSGLGRILVDLG